MCVLVDYVCAIVVQVPLTLCHGDFYAANVLLVEGPVSPDAVFVLDWWVLIPPAPFSNNLWIVQTVLLLLLLG